MNGSSGGSTSWEVNASVVNALWGSVMPRVAASIWRGKIPSPLAASTGTDFQPIDAGFLKKVWNRLAKVTFGSIAAYKKLRSQLNAPSDPAKAGFSSLQRGTHLVLSYYDPGVSNPSPPRMPLRLARAPGYDYILCPGGMDVFIPEDPLKNGNPTAAGSEILRYYKFRKTGAPPIGLPNTPDLASVDNLTEPTGTSQAEYKWVQKDASKYEWWITGSVFRALMTEFPRIVASYWYEQAVWDPDPSEEGWESTYTYKFTQPDGLKSLLEERLEVELPAAMKVLLDTGVTDVWVDPEGLRFPHPGDAPGVSGLLKSIELGQAGNPVFTDSKRPGI